MTVAPAARLRRERLVDAAAIATASLAALVFAAEAEQSGRVTGAPLFWSLVLTAIGCSALWWRRRMPVGVAVLLAPVAAITELVGAAVLIAVFTVAVRCRWPVTLAVAGLHALAHLPYAIVRPDPDLTVFGAIAASVVLLSITVASGLALRARRQTVASVRRQAEQAEREAERHAERLRTMERERIAREMHDVLAHRISLVSLHAGALEIRPDLSTEEVAQAASTIRANAHQALEDLREILGVLRGDAGRTELRPQPGLAELDRLIAECRATGTRVEVDNQLPGPAGCPSSVSRTAYRIVQEGLTNARKHAPGAPVQLRLSRTSAGELHVWLQNRLPSTAASPAAVPGSRSGLVGLAERVSLAGGRLDHGLRRGPAGELAFHLEAWLPWST